MQRLGPTKKRKVKAVSVLNVLATGLSLYAKQRVDFVQEMGDKELIIHKESVSLNKFLS